MPGCCNACTCRDEGSEELVSLQRYRKLQDVMSTLKARVGIRQNSLRQSEILSVSAKHPHDSVAMPNDMTVRAAAWALRPWLGQ